MKASDCSALSMDCPFCGGEQSWEDGFKICLECGLTDEEARQEMEYDSHQRKIEEWVELQRKKEIESRVDRYIDAYKEEQERSKK